MKRYDPQMDGSMEPYAYGRWVLYEDVPKRKPLTDEQIQEVLGVKYLAEPFIEFVRAIEAAHGIGEKK